MPNTKIGILNTFPIANPVNIFVPARMVEDGCISIYISLKVLHLCELLYPAALSGLIFGGFPMRAPFFFTTDGSSSLEGQIARTCQEAGAGAKSMVPPDRLQAMLLGGGYGRGEGGVLREDGTDLPYNDLEFFVFISGPVPLSDRRFRAGFDEMGHRLTEELGIEVEFKLYSLERLAAGETTMFHYDLASGHKMVADCGSATREQVLMACSSHLEAGKIPLHEATRLMMNRCTGLLYAERLLRAGAEAFGPDEADFILRNHAKLRLAMGDAVLTAQGRYHWSCQERHKLLSEGELFGAEPAPEGISAEQLRGWHRAAVEFKLHPRRATESREELQERHQELKAGSWAVWRWLETWRLGVWGNSPADYARAWGSKCPETGAIKNAALRLRTFGAAGVLSDTLKGRAMRYPREAVLRALPLLLWGGEDTGMLRPADLKFCGSLLHASVPDWSAAVAAYERLWRRFN